MKKFFKLGKRMLALFIVVLLNINSYAAVGANDGSAFVTKAEFDALVNTFNDQMDTYQSGLNAKIDGAISNYLAGLSSVSSVELDSYISNMREEDRTFLNNSAVSMLPTGGTTRQELAMNMMLAKNDNTNYSGFVRTNSNYYGAQELRVDTTPERDTNYKVFLSKLTIEGVTKYYPADLTSCIVRPIHRITGQYASTGGGHFTTAIALPTTSNWNIDSTVRIPGDNTCNGGTALSTTITLDVNHSISYDKDISTPNYLRYIPACNFTNTTNASHYGIDYDKRFEFDSTNQVSVNSVKGAEGGSRAWNYITNSQVGSRTNDVFIYKFYNMNQISYNPLDYINYSASLYYNEFVLKKEGIPLIKVDEPCTIEIPLNFVNSTGRCTVSIRKSRFSSDTPKTTKESDDLYWNDNVPSGDLDVIKIEQTDSVETTYWLKVLPNNENATSIVSLYRKIKKVTQ